MDREPLSCLGSFEAEPGLNGHFRDQLGEHVEVRHHDGEGDVPADRIEYTEGGTIAARDLEKMLRPSLGFIMRLRFRPSMKVDPNGVEWEAVTENAEVVTGRVVLHAGVAADRIVSWAEVVVDPHG